VRVGIIVLFPASLRRLRELTGGGVYLNFAGFGEDNDSLARSAYGRNYDRLCSG
jgi:hypothetical protein